MRYGGCVVVKPPRHTQTHKIIKAVEGSLVCVDCVDDPKTCYRADFCATLNLWKKLRESIRDVLEGVTLEDLAKKKREIIEQNTKGRTYYI